MSNGPSGIINRPKVIIYTEDSKSSYTYLSELNKAKRSKFIISPIHKQCGGNPKKLIDEALKDYTSKIELIGADNIAKCCVVFDLDINIAIENYQIAKNKAEKDNIEVYVFDPNFEYYHINHFKKCYKNCNKELEKHYNKSLDKIKSEVRLYTNLAQNNVLMQNAINNCKVNKDNRTNFYELMEFLINI